MIHALGGKRDIIEKNTYAVVEPQLISTVRVRFFEKVKTIVLDRNENDAEREFVINSPRTRSRSSFRRAIRYSRNIYYRVLNNITYYI